MPRPIYILIALLAAPISDSAAQRCLEPTARQLQTARAKASRDTLGSLQKALAARGLKKRGVKPNRHFLHEGPRGMGGRNARRPLPFARATRATINGVTGVFIGGPSAWGGSARPIESFEFVENQRGEIFRLVRAPRFTDRSIRVCGCQPQKCGPYGSGCPACFDTSQTVYGPLPAGAVYRGDVTVSYPAFRVTLDYAKTRGCSYRRCPAPPPSANRGRR